MAVIRELLTRFGVQVDEAGFKKFDSSILSAKNNILSLGATIAASLAAKTQFALEAARISLQNFSNSKEFDEIQKKINSITGDQKTRIFSKTELTEASAQFLKITGNAELLKKILEPAQKLAVNLNQDIGNILGELANFNVSGDLGALQNITLMGREEKERRTRTGDVFTPDRFTDAQRAEIILSRLAEQSAKIDEVFKNASRGTGEQLRRIKTDILVIVETLETELGPAFVLIFGGIRDFLQNHVAPSIKLTIKLITFLAKVITKIAGSVKGLFDDPAKKLEKMSKSVDAVTKKALAAVIGENAVASIDKFNAKLDKKNEKAKAKVDSIIKSAVSFVSDFFGSGEKVEKEKSVIQGVTPQIPLSSARSNGNSLDQVLDIFRNLSGGDTVRKIDIPRNPIQTSQNLNFSFDKIEINTSAISAEGIATDFTSKIEQIVGEKISNIAKNIVIQNGV